jgi:hypothetical protein
METVSDNSKGRGRPRKYDYEAMEEIAQISSAQTIRGKQNLELAAWAVHRLSVATHDPEFGEQSKQKVRSLLERIRPSVFSELGRFIEEEGGETEESIARFWEAVRFVADNPNMSARRTIRYLRRLRLGGGDDVHTMYALHDALIRTVNEYLERYPDLGRKGIHRALEITLKRCDTIGETEAGSEKE